LVYNDIKQTIDLYVDGKIAPVQAYHHLLQLKKPEDPEPVADSTVTALSATDSTTAIADTAKSN
jgi:hypothetical protein